MRLPAPKNRCSAALAALVSAALMMGGPAVRAEPVPGDLPLGEALSKLAELLGEAEEAATEYRETTTELKAQRTVVRKSAGRLRKAQRELAEGRQLAAIVVREQYREGTPGTQLGPYLRLLLSRDPQTALDRGHVISRAERERAAEVERLTAAAEGFERAALRSRSELSEQTALSLEQKEKRTKAEGRLRKVEEMVASLSEEQLAALDEIKLQGATDEQLELLEESLYAEGKNPAQDLPGKPSVRAREGLAELAAELRGKGVSGAADE